jgi:hypothetical protein
MTAMRRFVVLLAVWGGCMGAVSPSPSGGGLTPNVTISDPQAGLAPLRRLTLEQYVNTIRDLLGVSDPITADLPVDEGAGGFYSNIIAPITELQVEKYRAAAEVLAARAVENLPR